MHVDPTACVICPQPTGDPAAYACPACIAQIRRDLHAIADYADDARAVAGGQTRRSAPTSGHTTGSRVPIDLGASARLDAVQNTITTWARHVMHHQAAALPAGDPIAAAARYLAAHIGWLATRREIAEAARDIAAARRVIQSVVNPRTGRRYLGPCRGELPHGECLADVYARDGASVATCRSCHAVHDVAARRAWIDGEVRQHAYTAGEIADAYGIRAGTIRVWAHRHDRRTGVPLLMPALVPLPDGIEGPPEVDRDERGRTRYRLGDVLDRAAADADRRATRATRAEAA